MISAIGKLPAGVCVTDIRDSWTAVKQNILYHMHAIWGHEPPDQRFFRLYNKNVMCPLPQPICLPKVMHDPQFHLSPGYKGPMMVVVKGMCTPVLDGLEHELVDVADLDNPLGYKGTTSSSPYGTNAISPPTC